MPTPHFLQEQLDELGRWADEGIRKAHPDQRREVVRATRSLLQTLTKYCSEPWTDNLLVGTIERLYRLRAAHEGKPRSVAPPLAAPEPQAVIPPQCQPSLEMHMPVPTGASREN